MNSFEQALKRHEETMARVKALQPLAQRFAEMVITTLDNGGKLLWMGNGGSAADCQHLAAEFMVRYKNERHPLPAIALTTDTSLITAHANDYSFDSLFARQVQGLARPGDLVIGISTSGNSANIIQAIQQARAQGIASVVLSGYDGGKLAGMADLTLNVECHETARVQEAHIFIGHWLCEAVDAHIANR